MSYKPTARLPLTLILVAPLLLASRCGPPPTISRFLVQPTYTCAGLPVGVSWTYDADSATLTSSPHTDTPSGDLPGGNNAGWNFRTASTDTTFTLNAHRGGHPPATASGLARVVQNPFAIRLQLEYDCTNHYWERPAFTELEYDDALTIVSITNNHTQRLLVEGLDLGPGETRPYFPPRRFPGVSFRARLTEGIAPQCTGGPGGVGGGSPTNVPPPVYITVTSSCP